MKIPISIFLKETTKETCRLLYTLLPNIGGEKWWDKSVIGKLSHQQQNRVQRGQVSKLEDLDLAALLRVFDKNWFEISDKANLPYEGRNLVKEVQQVRHRAFHQGAENPKLDDIYRDLDTLKRYLSMIDADSDLLEKLEGERRRLLEEMTGPVSTDDDPTSSSDSEPPKDTSDELITPEAKDNEEREGHPEIGLQIKDLAPGAGENAQIRNVLSTTTFVGIDFGTSTTVVSHVGIEPERQAVVAIPIPVKQYDELGCCIEHHLVSSCIAWTGNELLVGQGAAKLKNDGAYAEDKNIWSNFKMELGIDLGPQYTRSELYDEAGQAVIRKPQDAAKVFFSYLRTQIETFVDEQKLPKHIIYSVSVPAAFEANQRQDLCNALSEAGIKLPKYGIIDEPNAAFISYLLETLQLGTGIADSIAENKRNVMVFDFGAGTCDISILRVSGKEGKLASRNMAISQFHALGGNNIDRQIVRESLLQQLTDELEDEIDFTTAELDQVVIPRLQPTAEALKIQFCKYIATNWQEKNIDPSSEMNRFACGKPVTLMIRGKELAIQKPGISFSDFADIMKPFLSTNQSEWSPVRRQNDLVSIFEPVQSAIAKAGIKKQDVDMVLFIGGSSLNPYVQNAIKQYFGRFVETITQSDLRTPVSKGTAINSFIVNGLGREIIKPITSETIYLVTTGGGLTELVPASTEIPTDNIFLDNLNIERDKQVKVEFPVCVTNMDKVLAVIELHAVPGRHFIKGEQVTLNCKIDENKLLKITAKCGNQMVKGALVNPLANKELTPEESRMMEAKQRLYISMSENKGSPPVHAVLSYAYACQEANHFIQAAEAFQAVERLDSNRDFSTQICYLYSRSGKMRLSSKWSELAYKREPSAVTAFNLALDKERNGDMEEYERLMEESLKHDPTHAAALEIYGNYLKRKSDPKGIPMIETAFEELKGHFDNNDLDKDNFFRLRRAADTLGRTDVIEQIERREKDLQTRGQQYNQNNLVGCAAIEMRTEGG